MTIENITNPDYLAEAIRDQYFYPPSTGEMSESEWEDELAELSVVVEDFDLKTGVIEVTEHIAGEEHERVHYLPELLGWTHPMHEEVWLDRETASEIGELVEGGIADKTETDREDILVQSFGNVAKAEFIDLANGPMGLEDALDDE